MGEKITFSFGKNWNDYLKTVSDADIERSINGINEYLNTEDVVDKTVIDVGCGSGMSSLAFYRLGAKSIFSFDFDEYSVKTTRLLWEKEGKPSNWAISQGSVLDIDEVLGKEKKFDIVYSWGVLHHTGAMLKAIDNCLKLVALNGKIWIALYQKGPKYLKHLKLKQVYNNANSIGKKIMIYRYIVKIMAFRLINLKNPFNWNERKGRGMSTYYDIIDWLGGLPYEVASENETLSIFRKLGFILEKINVANEGGCSNYIFSLKK